jgi:hypothetical protein
VLILQLLEEKKTTKQQKMRLWHLQISFYNEKETQELLYCQLAAHDFCEVRI